MPDLLAALPALTGIPTQLLDKSEASLDVIDRAIRQLGADRALQPDVFSALTAYVGEVIRELTQGSWATVPGQIGETVPCIVDESGRQYLPSRIYKELLEYGRRASTRAFVAGTVGSRRR